MCNDLQRLLYLGSLLAGVGFVVTQLLAGETRILLLTGGAAVGVLVLARASNYVRGFTTADEIRIDSITGVTPVRGQKGLTRPRFVVTYETAGEEKRRYVMMPSLWLSYGEAEFRRAMELFRDAGIRVEE